MQASHRVYYRVNKPNHYELKKKKLFIHNKLVYAWIVDVNCISLFSKQSLHLKKKWDHLNVYLKLE